MELDPTKVVTQLQNNLGDNDHINFCGFCVELEGMSAEEQSIRHSGCLIIHNFLLNFKVGHLNLTELIELVDNSLKNPSCENSYLLRQFRAVYDHFTRKNQLDILEQLLKK